MNHSEILESIYNEAQQKVARGDLTVVLLRQWRNQAGLHAH